MLPYVTLPYHFLFNWKLVSYNLQVLHLFRKIWDSAYISTIYESKLQRLQSNQKFTFIWYINPCLDANPRPLRHEADTIPMCHHSSLSMKDSLMPMGYFQAKKIFGKTLSFKFFLFIYFEQTTKPVWWSLFHPDDVLICILCKSQNFKDVVFK